MGAVVAFAGIVHSVVPLCGTFQANSVTDTHSEAGSHGFIVGACKEGERNFPLAMNKDPLDF